MSEKVALQLAGLQAQALMGDPRADQEDHPYAEPGAFLPQRIFRSRPAEQWVRINEFQTIVTDSSNIINGFIIFRGVVGFFFSFVSVPVQNFVFYFNAQIISLVDIRDKSKIYKMQT